MGGAIIFFPVWWYSRGLLRAWRVMIGALQNEARGLAIGVWLKNIFVPMYGAYDIWGRIISFFMRSAQIIGRTMVFLIYLGLLACLFLAYVALPILVVSQMIFHLMAFF